MRAGTARDQTIIIVVVVVGTRYKTRTKFRDTEMWLHRRCAYDCARLRRTASIVKSKCGNADDIWRTNNNDGAAGRAIANGHIMCPLQS